MIRDFKHMSELYIEGQTQNFMIILCVCSFFFSFFFSGGGGILIKTYIRCYWGGQSYFGGDWEGYLDLC